MDTSKTALISVFNKKNIVAFAKTLQALGYKIIATEGTGKELEKQNIDYQLAEEISKNPSGLESCIKTISFNIQAGILFDRLNPLHLNRIKDLKIEKIDLVVCNFVSLDQAVKSILDFNISNVDVGGPLMVRAAATNFKHVLIVIDPDDYQRVGEALYQNLVNDKLRQSLAAKAFAYTAKYDEELKEFLLMTGV